MKLDTIVVATDLSDHGVGALRTGMRVARALGAQLRVLHVLEPPYPQEVANYGVDLDLELSDDELAAAEEELREWVGSHLGTEEVDWTPIVRSGFVPEAIDEEANEHRALLVLGTHGRGFLTRAIIGSVAEATVRRATHPVLTVHEELSPNVKRILAPVDVAHSELQGIPLAESLRQEFDAEVHYLYAYPDPQRFPVVSWKHFPSVGESEFYEKATHRAQECLEARVRECIPEASPAKFAAVMGRPARAIEEYARKHEIDLIVMSTHGRTGIGRALLGSVAEKVVRVAPCPVWTIHQVD